MKTICATCLSTKRRLVPLKNMYTDFWSDICLNISSQVCYFCEAMFIKLWKFQQQVVDVQNILKKAGSIEYGKLLECSAKYSLNNSSVSHINYCSCCEFNNKDIIKDELDDLDEVAQNNVEENIQIEVKIDEVVVDNNMTDPVEFIIENDIKIQDGDDDGDNSKIQEAKYLEEVQESAAGEEKIQSEIKEDGAEFNVGRMSEEELMRAREIDKRNNHKYKIGVYKCEKCISGYASKRNYDKHNIDFHSKKAGEYTCRICDRRYKTERLMTTHFKKHYVCYECRLCRYRHHKLKKMRRHSRHQHESHVCEHCSSMFISKGRLRYHVEIKHKELPVCTICNAKLTSNSLKIHMKNHMGDVVMYTCDICKKVYKGKGCLRAHMRTHESLSNENSYCVECNKQFKNVYILRQHLKMHSKHRTDDLKYKCSHCNKQFPNKTGLKFHIGSIHLKKREYVCHICNKDFNKQNVLKNHIMFNHEGVPKPRNHVCTFCKKAFTSPQILANHIRIHTGEKPYECEICHSRFRQRTALVTHMRGVHKKI